MMHVVVLPTHLHASMHPGKEIFLTHGQFFPYLSEGEFLRILVIASQPKVERSEPRPRQVTPAAHNSTASLAGYCPPPLGYCPLRATAQLLLFKGATAPYSVRLFILCG